MEFFLVQSHRFLIWGGLLVLTIIVGDTIARLPLMGLYLIFFLVSSQYQNWKFSPFASRAVTAWLLFSLFLFFLLFTTHSLARSLEALIFFIFLAICYIFLLTQTSQKQFRSTMITVLIGVSVFVTVVSLLIQATQAYFWLPLPNFNLLYPAFGHNHLVAILLPAFPLAWYRFSTTKKWWYLASFLLFLLGILLSYSRVAVGLTAVALISMFWHEKFTSIRQAYRSQLLIALVTICIGVFALLLFNCSFLPARDKLCKPLFDNTRFAYWKQATAAVSDFPFTGYGLGTFALISQRYATTPVTISAFAHNAFLELFAETGSIGGVFFLVTMLLTVHSAVMPKAVQSKQSLHWQWFVRLAVLLSVTNFFLDYDFNHLAVAVILLIISVLAEPGKNERHDTQRRWELKLQQVGYIGLVGLLLIAVIVFVSMEVVRMYGRTAHVVKFFPYFFSQQQRLVEKGDISFDELQKIVPLVTFEPLLMQLLVEKYDFPQENELRRQMLSLAPWHFIAGGTADYFLKQENYIAAGEELAHILRLFTIAKQHGYEYSYEQQRAIAQKLARVANALLLEGDAERAGVWYSQVITIDPWFLHTSKQFPLPPDMGFSRLARFLDYSKLTAASFGRYALEMELQLQVAFLDELDTATLEDSQLVQNKGFIIKNEQIKQALLSQLTGNGSSPERTVKMFSALFAGEYWADALAGYYYVEVGEIETASREFERCLERHQVHGDCSLGLSFVRGQGKQTRTFSEIVAILDNKARWQGIDAATTVR